MAKKKIIRGSKVKCLRGIHGGEFGYVEDVSDYDFDGQRIHTAIVKFNTDSELYNFEELELISK